jgi:hypothetical protein
VSFGAFIGVAIVVIAMLIPLQIKVRAWQSGWGRLAKRYRLDGDPPAKAWKFLHVSFDHTRYSTSVGIGGDSRGLFLEHSWPNSIWHPRLIIPWNDVDIPYKQWVAMACVTMYLGPDRIEMQIIFGIPDDFATEIQAMHAAARTAPTDPCLSSPATSH